MEAETLRRGIGRWDLLAMAINTVIGAGIFGLPAKATALIGSYSLLALILCAAIFALIVLCFSEVASRFEATGGMYLYAREAFGNTIGFEIGWLYWVVRVTTLAANCNLLVGYLGFFHPQANQGGWRVLFIAATFLLIGLVNFLGIRQSAIMTNLFTCGKLLPLLIFASVGLFFLQPANFSLPQTVQYDSFASATLILVYAFSGFEATTILAGEAREPRRNLPFALLASLAIVAALYVLIMVVCIGTLPALATSERPLADAAVSFLGFWGASFITAGALVSILGNLNIGFLAASRIPYAMAEQKELPEFIGKTHHKFKTPHISLLITLAVILVFTIQSNFITALTIATITRLIVYAATCAALPVFRFRGNAPQAAFTAPLGIMAAVLSLGLIAWLLAQVDFTKEGLALIIAAGAGLLLYFGNTLYRKKLPAQS